MMTPLERFEQKYIPEPNSGCWLWIGASWRQKVSLPSQYGLMRFPKPRGAERAHRISYELHRGEIPPGMCVLHRCDQPCCVNPEHLFLGTIADNNKDMLRKGRSDVARGAKHYLAKLTDDMVREIRCAPGPLRQIADRFGVHIVTISEIKRRKRWKSVSDE